MMYDAVMDGPGRPAIYAAVYARQSRKSGDGSEVSTSVQVEEGTKRAESMGAEALDPYVDLGISAYDPTAERADFERMMKDARAGKFSYVVVYYMSRFSRQEPLEVLSVVRELWAYGVTIVSVVDGEFPPGDFGALISLLVRLEGNHKESKIKSVNVRRTKRAARELGGYMGGSPPYGFTVKKVLREGVAIQVLEPHPVEGPIVAELVDYLLEHIDDTPGKFGSHPASRLSAVDWLNAHPDAFPRRGKRWNEASVTRILIDPRIAGFAAEYVYYKAADEERRRKTREYLIVRDDEGREVHGNEPLVDPKKWYKLQAWFEQRKQRGRLPQGDFLFSGSGLLYCECGKKMAKFAPRGNVPNYRCQRRPKDDEGRTHNGGNSIATSHTDDWVARRVMTLLMNVDADNDDATFTILAEAAKRFVQLTEPDETAGERAELLQARVSDTRALEDLYNRDEEGDFDDPIGRQRFRDRREKILARIKAANTRLAELDTAERPTLPIEEWCGDPSDDSRDPLGPESWWQRATLVERREFLNLFVDRVTVRKAASKGGNRIGVTYNASERLEIKWATPETQDA